MNRTFRKSDRGPLVTKPFASASSLSKKNKPKPRSVVTNAEFRNKEPQGFFLQENGTMLPIHSLSVILLTNFQQTDLRVAKSIDHKETAVFVVKTNFLTNLVRRLKCAHRVQDPIEVLRLSREASMDVHCGCIVKFDNLPSDFRSKWIEVNHDGNFMAVDGSSCKPPILFPP